MARDNIVKVHHYKHVKQLQKQGNVFRNFLVFYALILNYKKELNNSEI